MRSMFSHVVGCYVGSHGVSGTNMPVLPRHKTFLSQAYRHNNRDHSLDGKGTECWSITVHFRWPAGPAYSRLDMIAAAPCHQQNRTWSKLPARAWHWAADQRRKALHESSRHGANQLASASLDIKSLVEDKANGEWPNLAAQGPLDEALQAQPH